MRVFVCFSLLRKLQITHMYEYLLRYYKERAKWYTVPGTSYFLPVPGEFLSDKNTTRNLTAAAKHMSSRSNLLLYMEAIPANNEYEPTIANGN